ncbi:MAG: DUF1294 domain-containing protein [Clostridia bacterium]|nr:DUF1294 domain-containing protein [Clostridia bacterium]
MIKLNLYNYLIIYCTLINILAFLAMAIDKYMAIRHYRRISEKTLFTISLILGSLGIYIGMQVFRHKTKHKKFIILIPVLFILNCISVYYIITYVYPYILNI